MLIAFVTFLVAQFWGGDAGVTRSISRFHNRFNIVGGKAINITDVPYQVSITWDGWWTSCTGVLIAADVVLTSAECVRLSRDPSDYYVRAGSDYTDDGGEYVEAKKIWVHPKSKINRLDYYIGLLWLSKKLPLSDKIATIEMLNQGEEIEDGESVFVSGWGAESDRGDFPINLHRAEVNTFNLTLCADFYKPFYVKLTPRMMCTLKAGSGFCVGDWGAPLVYKGKVAGVTAAFINDCGDPIYPQMYAKVSSMRDAIDEALKNNTINN